MGSFHQMTLKLSIRRGLTRKISLKFQRRIVFWMSFRNSLAKEKRILPRALSVRSLKLKSQRSQKMKAQQYKKTRMISIRRQWRRINIKNKFKRLLAIPSMTRKRQISELYSVIKFLVWMPTQQSHHRIFRES